MNQAMEKSIRQTRFAIDELQKRISVLEITREDLTRQINKLMDSVPEDEVDPQEQRDGYVSYGSYAQSVIKRKDNLRSSLDDILEQQSDLASELKIALDALDSFERVKARQLASKAEKEFRRKTG